MKATDVKAAFVKRLRLISTVTFGQGAFTYGNLFRFGDRFYSLDMKPFSVHLAILSLIVLGMVSLPINAQVEEVTGARKVVSQVSPAFPPLARTMNLTGAVRLMVVVEPSGSVKSVQERGGSPVFVQAAESAVRAWKWEKRDHETTESVEVRFHQ